VEVSWLRRNRLDGTFLANLGNHCSKEKKAGCTGIELW
jgi:hypothetical protein